MEVLKTLGKPDVKERGRPCKVARQVVSCPGVQLGGWQNIGRITPRCPRACRKIPLQTKQATVKTSSGLVSDQHHWALSWGLAFFETLGVDCTRASKAAIRSANSAVSRNLMPNSRMVRAAPKRTAGET